MQRIIAHPQARSNASKNTSSQISLAKIHRQIFQSNQRKINECVAGYTEAFRKYERAYQRAVRSYQRRENPQHFIKKIHTSQIIFMGDYHTLPQSQRAFCRILRHLPKSAPTTIALEFIAGKHQKMLDRYMAGDVDDHDFLQILGMSEKSWSGHWKSFRDIFDIAKKKGFRLLALDSSGRGPEKSSLDNRDIFAAKRIAQELKRFPKQKIIALVGEWHVAPCHLPKHVRKQCGTEINDLIIYQNCEQIYHQLEESGLHNTTSIVRVAHNAYCMLNTPPIVCQQSFLNWVDSEDDDSLLDTPEANIRTYTRMIADLLKLPLNNALDDIEITTVADLRFLNTLQKRGHFSKRDMRIMRKQILNSESYYIPRCNMIYLGNLSINHAAEESTHFLRRIFSNSGDEPTHLIDAFYARCIEEAIGFLGSKIVNIKRKCSREEDLQRIARSKSTSNTDRHAAKLTLRHLRWEENEKPRILRGIYESHHEIFNAVTHLLGYILGEKLYHGLMGGVFSRDEIRDLFFEDLEAPGNARFTYLFLRKRTQKISLPEKLP